MTNVALNDDYRKLVKHLLIVFAIALIARSAYLWVVKSGELGNPDSPGYQSLAETIQARKPYSITELGPGQFPMDLLRPPGYPFFLYLLNFDLSTGVSRLRVAISQSFLGALFASLLVVSITKLFTPSVGLWVGIIYAIDWVTILHTPLLVADFLFSVLLTLAITSYGHYLKNPGAIYGAFTSGLLLGLAALVKPAAQIHIAAFLLSWLFWRHRKVIGLLFVLSYFIVTVPWMGRNWQKYDIFTLSAIDTAALYSYMATGALRAQAGTNVANPVNTIELDGMAIPRGTEALTVAEKNSYMRREALGIIKQHWKEVLKQGLVGLAITCLGPGRETLAQALPGGKPPSRLWSTYLPLLQNILVWLAILIGSVALIKTPQIETSIKILIFSTLCLTILPSASPLGYSRFRVHAVPLLSILAAMGFIEIGKKLRSKYDNSL